MLSAIERHDDHVLQLTLNPLKHLVHGLAFRAFLMGFYYEWIVFDDQQSCCRRLGTFCGRECNDAYLVMMSRLNRQVRAA